MFGADEGDVEGARVEELGELHHGDDVALGGEGDAYYVGFGLHCCLRFGM